MNFPIVSILSLVKKVPYLEPVIQSVGLALDAKKLLKVLHH